MHFRTIVEINKSLKPISHASTISMFGSCFAENIGERLKTLKFNIDLNPFGILFNPISIAQSIQQLIEQRNVTETELFLENDCWNAFSHHSRFSLPQREQTLEGMNKQIAHSAAFLKKSNTLIITFGTAWVYKLKKNGTIVANCHKQPASAFERHLLSVEEITNCYKTLLDSLYATNTHLQIILTISPVRHLKDTPHGNQLSKSILQIAINELITTYPIDYFPAYEIMLDDLRDYRFYAPDMVHPSETAIDYIFDKFGHAYFSEETNKLNAEIQKIAKDCLHRPTNRNSSAHKKFVEQVINRMENIEKSQPLLSFSEERKLL